MKTITKRIIILIIFSFVISFTFVKLTNNQLPWYSVLAFGILGCLLSRALIKEKDKV